MKTWTAKLDIEFTLSEVEIANSDYADYFKDPKNPTDKEIRNYFLGLQENYAGSNDGSELIANADMSITCEQTA